MKKCPNCKKAIPVGARRCVHCRTLITEDGEQNSTAIGVGNDFGRDNSSTSLGRPGRAGGFDDIPDFGHSSSTDDAPHHTMLGLGPIAAAPMPASRRSNPLDSYNDAPVNHTMAGIPCIGSNMSKNEANELGRSIQNNFSSPSPKPSVAVPAPKEPKIPEPEAKADDPLAGLAGVSAAPVPSSLVDEEFIDLTAKLFGDDFASIGSEVADEVDDGWDFDFDPVDEGESEEPLDKATVPVTLSDEMKAQLNNAVKKEVQPVSTTHKEEPKVEEKPVEEVKPASEPVAEEAPKAEEAKEPAKKAENKSSSSTSVMDKIALVVAIIAGILSVAWLACVPEGASLGSEIPLLAVSILALAFDAVSSKLVNKIGNYGMLAGFVVAAIALIFVMNTSGMVAAGASTVKTILVVAALGQFICAFLYFNRKN